MFVQIPEQKQDLFVLLKVSRCEALGTKCPVCCNCRGLFSPSLKLDVHPCPSLTSFFTNLFSGGGSMAFLPVVCMGRELTVVHLPKCYVYFLYVFYIYVYISYSVTFLKEIYAKFFTGKKICLTFLR